MLASMVCGQIALSRGERDMWFQSSFIVLLLVISVLCFAAFLSWDSRDGNQNPVFHVSTILSQRTYTAAFGVVLLCGIFLGAGLYVIPRACWILQSAVNPSARANGTSVSDPGNYELFQGLRVAQARLLAFIDICFCLAVAAAIGLIVLAFARWRQLHAVEHPHLTPIVGR
jgi:hypothetical protein